MTGWVLLYFVVTVAEAMKMTIGMALLTGTVTWMARHAPQRVRSDTSVDVRDD